jgi:hypothetical protein
VARVPGTRTFLERKISGQINFISAFGDDTFVG